MAGILPFSSLLYPTAPQMLPWVGKPNVSQTNPRQWRMLQFGPYWFPPTFQVRNIESKLSLIKKKLPFNFGDYNPGNTSMSGRTLEFYGTIGPGVYGNGGTILKTQADVENERQLLSGLQTLGKQSLYISPDKFIWAYLEDFTSTYQDGAGFRLVDWSAKFYADDPRWYGASSGPSNSTNTGGQGTGGLPNMNSLISTTVGTPHTGAFSAGIGPIYQNGNTKAFPIFILTVLAGTITAPFFSVSLNNSDNTGIGITFSKFNSSQPMNAGDILVVMCDPRPEYQLIAATYYPGGGWPTGNTTPVNAMQFCSPANGDLLNTIDFQYFLPWLSSQTVDDGSGSGAGSGTQQGLVQANFQCNGTSQEHQLQILWYDTYI